MRHQQRQERGHILLIYRGGVKEGGGEDSEAVLVTVGAQMEVGAPQAGAFGWRGG